MGALTKKTQRHDTYEVRIPPSSRPMAPPAPAMPAQTPSARLRGAPIGKGRGDQREGRRRGESGPGALDGARRSSHHSDVAKPPTSEASEKSSTPVMKMRRRP